MFSAPKKETMTIQPKGGIREGANCARSAATKKQGKKYEDGNQKNVGR
jgi:hypothetical protein